MWPIKLVRFDGFFKWYFLLKRQNISYKFDQNDFWCSHVLKIRYNSLFNICWYWWNPSLFVVLLYRFSKSISLNKMPAVIFYLNVHGNHILPQFLFLFSLQINSHFILPVELLGGYWSYEFNIFYNTHKIINFFRIVQQYSTNVTKILSKFDVLFSHWNS